MPTNSPLGVRSRVGAPLAAELVRRVAALALATGLTLATAGAVFGSTATAHSGGAIAMPRRVAAPESTARTAPDALAVPASVPMSAPTLPLLPDGLTSGVSALSSEVRGYMTGRSWHVGCPVALDDLRLVIVTYAELGGPRLRRRTGPLVVQRAVAAKIAAVFDRLLAADFPIARVQLVDDFEADDDRSTLANNTSAFNCRRAEGSTAWSQHAFGRAVDVNPVENPYVYADGTVLDPAAMPFRDRSASRGVPGVIADASPAVQAFAAVGWRWGGRWSGTKDYQHFSSNGR